ncbi:borealin-like [Ceratina calcarata]|uniref:Borealin-like n=1 Tax=Ceratina calcarata TaxID=156304 RepID=A0AAJ7W867_9HYME|nr:borealin-like [Ceratina calcarata]XP_026666687.1 borealin-like [Ceratina calcarata]
MPRTKHARKPKVDQFTEESDLLIRDFERKAHLRILKMEGDGRMAIRSLETFIDGILAGLPSEVLQMTLGEILGKKIENEKENYNEVSSSIENDMMTSVSKTVKQKKTSKRITSTTDDGYMTEEVPTTCLSRARNVKRNTTARTTRSSSRNSKLKFIDANQSTVKKTAKKEDNEEFKKFKTPAASKPGGYEFSVVTPKIKPNTPLNVLRRPRQGEMVLSMQGSPLLVSAIVEEHTANVNVPLRNGNVISLLPNDGLRMSNIPTLDPETMRQLETLKDHINKVISSK